MDITSSLDFQSRSAAALFGSAAAGLLLTTLVSAVLGRAAAGGRPQLMAGAMVRRVNAAWLMLAAVALAMVVGQAALVLLFAFVSLHALHELLTLVPHRRADRAAIVVAYFGVLPLQYLLVWKGWYGLFAVAIPVFTMVLLPVLSALAGDTQRYLERQTQLQWGLMISVYCVSHLPALAMLQLPGFEGRQLLLLVFVVVVVLGGGLLQSLCGQFFGRHPLPATLASGTSWEGMLGGWVGGTLLGTALHGITPFTAAQAAALSALLCGVGFLGGLVLAAIKRDRGIQHWGRRFDGHRGMLDRLGPLVFAAPVFFHLVRGIWAS